MKNRKFKTSVSINPKTSSLRELLASGYNKPSIIGTNQGDFVYSTGHQLIQNPILPSSGSPDKIRLIENQKELQLLNNMSYEKNKWPGLALLHSKGSSHTKPNFNILNYNFQSIVGGDSPSTISYKSKAAAQPWQGWSKDEILPSPSLKGNNIYNKLIIDNVYQLLFNFFKSMYCLIGKPVFIITQDKIIIQLFYYNCIGRKFSQQYKKSAEGTTEFVRSSTQKVELDLNKQQPAPSLWQVGSANNWPKAKAVTSLSKSAASDSSNASTALPKLGSYANQWRLSRVSRIIKVHPAVAGFSDLTKVYPKKFKFICNILSRFFNKTVELELIRLHKPYYDSNILVNFLSLIVNKKDVALSIRKIFSSDSLRLLPKAYKSFPTNCNSKALPIVGADSVCFMPEAGKGAAALVRRNSWNNLAAQPWQGREHLLARSEKSINLIDSWFGNNLAETRVAAESGKYIPATAYLTGINIKISGRLKREAIIPKVTTKKFEKGFIAKGKINYSDIARFTHKNRKGAFSITIKSGQNF